MLPEEAKVAIENAKKNGSISVAQIDLRTCIIESADTYQGQSA